MLSLSLAASDALSLAIADGLTLARPEALALASGDTLGLAAADSVDEGDGLADALAEALQPVQGCPIDRNTRPVGSSDMCTHALG